MFAAFHIADLPVTAALQQQPEWHDHPCAILRDPTGKDDGKIPLLALNPAARLTGIAPGWPLGRALVRCPDLRVLPRHPETETLLLTELVALADTFTADVEITSADTVLLDLAGTKRVHFNELETLPRTAVEVCHALAETPDLAHFAVLEPRTRGRFISVREIGTLPLSLIDKLEGDGKFLPLLELLGLRTLEDYCRLPRQGLTERFGPRAGHWHDLISGKTCRLLKLHRPPESFLQTIDFDDAIHSSEALLFVFNRMLHVLASRLAARHLAASVLAIHLRLIEGNLKREIHLPEPLADPAALLKPIQTLIESLLLPAPVIALELDATAALPLSRQSDWTKRQLPNPGRWADTLARLEALVGGGNVGIPVPLEIHRPDAFELREATTGGSVRGCLKNGRDRSPQRSGECEANESAHETLGNPSMVDHSLPILADRPEVDPCLRAFFRQPQSTGHPLPACGIPLRRFRPPVTISVAFEATPDLHPRPLALLTGPHCGRVLERRGPFPSSGNYWNPAETWRRVEWDIRVEHAPLLRLVYQPEDRWQIDGSYS